MAFIDSTSDQRIELLRQADKTANLTRRVTIGSGNLGEPEGTVGAELCTALADALEAIGYGGVPSDGALVTNGQAATIKVSTTNNLAGDHVFEVSNNKVTAVKLGPTVGIVVTNSTFPLQNSTGTIHGGNVQATVDNNRVTVVKAPATTGIVRNQSTLPVHNAAGTLISADCIATVGDGILSSVALPATIAAVVDDGTVNVANAPGSATVAGATYVVTAGVATTVVLPASHALVTTGPATALPVTGTYTTSVAFTVSDGVITGIVLS